MKKFITTTSLLILIVTFIDVSLQINNIKPVTATKLNTTNYNQYINVTGELESGEKETIIMSFPIYIKEVFVKENSYVNKGQAIFSIDKAKMLDLISIQTNKNNQNILNEIENIPDNISASSSGIITELNISDNSIALSGNTLCSISKTENIIAKFTLNQIEYGDIEIGDEVLISSVAFEKEYDGKISDEPAIIYKEISTFGGQTKVDIFAEFNQADYSLIDGLQVNGKIKTDTFENIKILNYNYINQDEKGEYVYILNDDKAKKIYITTGIELENGVEITNDFPENSIFIKGDIFDNDLVVVTND